MLFVHVMFVDQENKRVWRMIAFNIKIQFQNLQYKRCLCVCMFMYIFDSEYLISMYPWYAYGIVSFARWVYLSTSLRNLSRVFQASERSETSAEISHEKQCHMHFLARLPMFCALLNVFIISSECEMGVLFRSARNTVLCMRWNNWLIVLTLINVKMPYSKYSDCYFY